MKRIPSCYFAPCSFILDLDKLRLRSPQSYFSCYTRILYICSGNRIEQLLEMSISYESKIGFAVLKRVDKSSSLFIYFKQNKYYAVFFFLIDTSKKQFCRPCESDKFSC